MPDSILLITPPYHCGVVEVAGRWMPLGLLYLAGAARRAGWTPLVYDAMTKDHGHEEIRDKIAGLRPTCVATTAITSTYPDALQLLKTAKELDPAVTTIIGGVHPTFMYEQILEEAPGVVDYVVLGEGEETLQELLARLGRGEVPHDVHGLAFRHDGETVVTLPRPFLDDLDHPEATWDLVEWPDYRYFVIPGSRLAVVSTARGCSFNCSFCSQQKFYKQSWRARDPVRAAEEILELKRRYGPSVFLVADEHPTHDQARWREFLDRLIAAKFDGYLLMETRAEDIVRDAGFLHRYREAGVVHVYVGLEATDQSTLDSLNKELSLDVSVESLRLLREHGMVSETSFVLGFPWETQQTIEATLALSKRFNPDFAHYLAITPWPYADLFEEMRPHIVDWDYRRYNLIDPVIKPEAMSIEAIDLAIVDCYRQFYMGKIGDIDSDPDAFRQRYLLISMQLMMRSSFLQQKLGASSLARIPVEVERILKRLGESVSDLIGS